MSGAKFTPGPWQYASGVVDAPNSGGHARMICQGISASERGYGSRDQRQAIADADGALIAAAPDLYAALVMVRDADEDRKRDGYRGMPYMPRAAIDRAIARAEGRS